MDNYSKINHIDYDSYTIILDKGYVKKLSREEFRQYLSQYSIKQLTDELKYFDIEARKTKEEIIEQFIKEGDFTLITTPEGETLLSLPMEEDFHDVIDYMMANYPEIRRVYRRGSIASYEWVRGEDMEYASKLLTGEPCYKFVIVCDTENDALRLMDDMVRRFGDRYEYDRSWPIGLEMHRKHSGKDVCLQHLRKILPDVHTIIAAGDYENDIPMLRAADIGCAVGNALPSVKEAADRVIVTNEEHAIAYIINELIPSLK